MLDKTVEERIIKSLNHEEGDRVPIWDYLDNRGIYEYFAKDESDYGKGMVKVYHSLGIDLCRGYGASFAKTQNGTTAPHGEWLISGQTQWQVKYPIQSLDDLKNYPLPQLYSDETLANWIESIRVQQERFAPYTMYVPGAGCGFHGTYGMMGLSLFCLAIYDARDAMERLLWANTENSVRLAKAAAKADLGPIYFVGDDIAYKGTTMFSPQFLRETFIKCLKNVCEPLKNAGIKVIFHSDGNVMSVLDDMIDAGIDGLNPIEPIAGMDIGYLKKRYGKNLVLVGNVDCSQVLPLGTVEEVIEATKECIRQASKGGGHFIGSSSEIVPATPVENILAFYRTVHEYGKYPIRI
jgi:uroporphyrinogen decarboxylase